MFIKDEIVHACKPPTKPYKQHSIACLKIDQNKLARVKPTGPNKQSPILTIYGCYIPQKNPKARYYTDTVWADLTAHAMNAKREGQIVIGGDFNGRVGTYHSPLILRSLAAHSGYEIEHVHIKRASQDTITKPNNHGDKFDTMCTDLNAINIHGLRKVGPVEVDPARFDDGYTYAKIGAQNKLNTTTIDTFMTDLHHISTVHSFKIIKDNKGLSDHFPIVLTLHLPTKTPLTTATTTTTRRTPKPKSGWQTRETLARFNNSTPEDEDIDSLVRECPTITETNERRHATVTGTVSTPTTTETIMRDYRQAMSDLARLLSKHCPPPKENPTSTPTPGNY